MCEWGVNLSYNAGIHLDTSNGEAIMKSVATSTYLNLERQSLSDISPAQTTALGQSTAIEHDNQYY